MLKKLVGVVLLGIMSLHAQNRVYEMRTYVAPEGKLENLLTRFRDHTLKFFEKYGMESVGYWVVADGPESKTTLVYILAHKSRDAAKASWDAFRKDPDWNKARTASEADGKIVDKVTSVFLNPTDFSKLK